MNKRMGIETHPLMTFDILTIFPDLLQSPLNEGIIRQARDKNQIAVHLNNVRDFAFDKHQITDDRPFGGGEGMVMKADPLSLATRHVKKDRGNGKVVLLSPQGQTLNQSLVKELADTSSHLILVCGRYEGVDERYRASYVDQEISIGDYILSGGELGAMVLVDSITRILPGVLGCSDSVDNDTFSRSLLKHPQYTRPREFEEVDVPEPLLSGNHKVISEYRFIESVTRTIQRRPDLVAIAAFGRQEIKLLKKARLFDTISRIKQGYNNNE